MENQWPMPEWHESLPADEQAKAETRVLLDLAAIYATPEGTCSALARRLGYGHTALTQARRRGKIGPELCVKLESLLGREHFPRELFRPDLFAVGS